MTTVETLIESYLAKPGIPDKEPNRREKPLAPEIIPDKGPVREPAKPIREPAQTPAHAKS
ncbi:hypothetical protein M1563_01560 [Patescibacteria group bacterium]|nr:hypothetical protein [Patescibacteria group bacterium]MCL5409972.1 hypothetical protein [Patescibacteria group bacterium]